MSDGRSDFYSFLGGFLAGAVIGGLLGILFAPKAGEETRRDIKEKAEEFYEKGKVVYGEQKERLQQAVESGKEAISTKGAELKEKIEETAAKLKEKAETPKPVERGKPAEGRGKTK